MILYIICFILFALPLTIIFPVAVFGRKNVKELKKKKQNYIVACNHMSNWDPVIVDLKFCKMFVLPAKKELFKNKFKGGLLKYLGGVPVDRNSVDIAATRTVLRKLTKKKSVCIFPQGTRCVSPRIEEGSAKEGVAMFSIRTGVPVVPVVFNKKIKAFKKTKMFIGKPLYPDVARKHEKGYQEEFADLIVKEMNALLEGEQK